MQLRYDPKLQMFVDEPHMLNYHTLAFMRALAETGHFGHLPLGDPSGRVLDSNSEILALVRTGHSSDGLPILQPLSDEEKVSILGQARLGVCVYAAPDILDAAQDE